MQKSAGGLGGVATSATVRAEVRGDEGEGSSVRLFGSTGSEG